MITNALISIRLIDFTLLAALYILFLAGVLGLVMGSFCNAWAWRIVHHERITHGRSHCPDCGHVLSPLDLVPLFSFLALGGKCRYCKNPISARYPLTEFISMVFYTGITLRFGFSIETLEFLMVGSLMLTASLVDIDIMELPDGLLIGIGLVSVLRLTEGFGVLPGMIAGFAGVAVPLLILVLIMEHVLKKEAMGGGDIKLIAVLGLHLGIMQTLLMLIIACFVGLAAAAIGRKGRDSLFPFGPSIAIAAWITMLCGSNVIEWYLGLFGL